MERETLRRSLRAAAVGLAHRLGLWGRLGGGASRWTLRSRRGFPALRRRRHKCFQVLTYHRVTDGGDSFLPGTPVAAFERQMAFVAAHYRVCSLETAVTAMLAGDLPDRALVITFDDGYRDNYVRALPVLQRHALPATVFLATGSIGTGRVLWHDRVFRAFRETPARALSGFAGNGRTWPLETPEQREQARDAVLAVLKTLGEEQRLETIARLTQALEIGDVEQVPGLMLGWDEVREMSRAGIEFGSHSVTHPILSRIPAERARQEVFESKAVLERELGRPVRAFAYPNGQPADFDDRTTGLLRDAGFACAVTTIRGLNALDALGEPPDLFRLRRQVPWHTDVAGFAAQLAVSRLAGG